MQVNNAYGNQQNQGQLQVPAIQGGLQSIKGHQESNTNSQQTIQYLRNIKFIQHDALGGTFNNLQEGLSGSGGIRGEYGKNEMTVDIDDKMKPKS